jgi:hypothetical protein
MHIHAFERLFSLLCQVILKSVQATPNLEIDDLTRLADNECRLTF